MQRVNHQPRLSNLGTQGPYGIFIAATAYVVTLLYTLQRGPRIVSHSMLLLWHIAATTLVVRGTLQGGPDATLQGQGLHFEIPLWILSAPFLLFTITVLLWVILDVRSGTVRPAPWSRPNSNRLVISFTLVMTLTSSMRLSLSGLPKTSTVSTKVTFGFSNDLNGNFSSDPSLTE